MQLTISGYNQTVEALLRARAVTVLPLTKRMNEVVLQGDYTMPEASVNVPFEEALLTAVEDLAIQLRTPQLRFIFLVGIGGSNLGTEAIYEALFAAHDIAPDVAPQLITLDTNNATTIEGVLTLIETIRAPEEWVLVSVSKSGGTTETIANTEIMLEALKRQCGHNITQRVVVISDLASPFLLSAKNAGMHTFAIPPLVGGRYSVFTAVGLLPLALLSVNIRELVTGAQAAVQQAIHHDIALNPATQLAVLAHDAHQSGKCVHDFFVFNREMEKLGKWWRQLVGESCGKQTLHTQMLVGITPTVSIGSTDLHSVGQLYLGGPADKFTLFVYASPPSTVMVPVDRMFPSLVPMVTGKRVDEVMEAILRGTMAAYTERERPYVMLTLPRISPFELGFLMQFLMITTIYTGRLLDVNPFDQPDVEAYKRTTKHLLEQQSI